MNTVQEQNPILMRLIFPSIRYYRVLSRSLLLSAPTAYLSWSGCARYYPGF